MVRTKWVMWIGDYERFHFNPAPIRVLNGSLVTFDRSGTELIYPMGRSINQLATVPSLTTAECIQQAVKTHLDMLRISGLKEPYIGIPRSKPSFSPSVIHSDKMSFNAVTPLTKDT
jgi:hypothetical protein